MAKWLDTGFGEALGGAIPSMIGGLIGRRKSIPKPFTADQIKSRMDTIYPGTTPWERLGSQGGGVPSMSATQDSAKIQAQMMNKQHINDMIMQRQKNESNERVANDHKKAALLMDAPLAVRLYEAYADDLADITGIDKQWFESLIEDGKDFIFSGSNKKDGKTKQGFSIPIAKGQKRKYTPKPVSPDNPMLKRKSGRIRK